MLDLSDMLPRRASGLTADGKQKISLGRGLVRSDVNVIMFDEPLTVIDPHLKWQLRSKLKELHQRTRRTMIYVTHDQTEALTFAEKVVVMHEGRVVQVGSPVELFERPRHTFVGHFIGSPGMNVLPCEVSAGGVHFAGRQVDVENPPRRPLNGRHTEIGVRPEFVVLSGQGIPVDIVKVSDAGRYRIVEARCEESRIKLLLEEGVSLPASNACVRFDPAHTRLYADGRAVGVGPTMDGKTQNQMGWLFVLPVVALVAFNAVIPLMAVVNYSVQETFGNNMFFFEGVKWFEQVLHSDRFHASLGRQLIFSGIILVIEVPLGVAIALAMPRRGPWVSVCLVLMALPLLIPWNVVGAMWNIFALPDIGMLGRLLNDLGFNYNYTQQPISAWATLIAMDVWHWTSLVVLLAYAGLSAIPDAYYQAAKIDGASAWAVFRYIQLPKMRACSDDRRAVALYGQLQHPYRALRIDGRRTRQCHDLVVDRPGQDRARSI